MAKTHTVQQGDTLARIAKQYKYSSASALYNHPDNKEFRSLRNNPNIIYPGDKICIPEIENKVVSVNPAKKHIFRLKPREKELFKVKIQNASGKAWEGKRVLFKMGSQVIDAMIASDGIVEVELPNGDESSASLDIFMDPTSDEPTHQFEVELGGLDPVETLSGVQARCNLLGHDCGVADGIMGAKTRTGIKSFQAANDLDVDGILGPMTEGKLRDVYGC